MVQPALLPSTFRATQIRKAIFWGLILFGLYRNTCFTDYSHEGVRQPQVTAAKETEIRESLVRLGYYGSLQDKAEDYNFLWKQ